MRERESQILELHTRTVRTETVDESTLNVRVHANIFSQLQNLFHRVQYLCSSVGVRVFVTIEFVFDMRRHYVQTHQIEDLIQDTRMCFNFDQSFTKRKVEPKSTSLCMDKTPNDAGRNCTHLSQHNNIIHALTTSHGMCNDVPRIQQGTNRNTGIVLISGKHGW